MNTCELDVIESGRAARLALEPFDLLTVPECPSPKEAWRRAHSLNAEHLPDLEGTEFLPWLVWNGATPSDKNEAIRFDIYGEGETEDEALFSWAVKNGVKSWIELKYERAVSPPVVSQAWPGASVGSNPPGDCAEGCSPHCGRKAGVL